MQRLLAFLAIFIILICGIFVFRRLIGIYKLRHSHRQIAEVAEDISGIAKVAAAVAALAAWSLAPVGIYSFFVSPPLVVLIAPFIIAFAMGASALSSVARIYANKADSVKKTENILKGVDSDG
ncbi:hypothetical protein E8Q33_13915 [Methylophaga sp. SB9B]|uniref:hypothetical protein n=1 Tax=Methylophaga sp. SB9B TaxID=2570356 RepID=UPI0010A753F9|nr:hypothetical protein [Methylophaga sp. SB9B]THK40507.1 hypothetical protein E8Q33_13915 [Methylophaga sp. SB9B]